MHRNTDAFAFSISASSVQIHVQYIFRQQSTTTKSVARNNEPLQASHEPSTLNVIRTAPRLSAKTGALESTAHPKRHAQHGELRPFSLVLGLNNA